MSIEILDYSPQTSGGACIGIFSVRFINWKNFTVTEFRHCCKGQNEWVDLPQKFKKNEDGSWEKPTSRSFFPDDDDNKALKRVVLQKLSTLDKKTKVSNEQPELPF